MPDFNREEKKYRLGSLQAVELVNYLQDFIPFEKRTEELITNNRSVYFDDNNFSLYSLSLDKNAIHYKLRLRDYGYKNKFNKTAFVELKEKEHGVSRKHRFLIQKKDLQNFITGKKLDKKINRINKKKDPTPSMKIIEDFMEQGSYQPIMVTEYNRISFEIQMETRVRITLDRNVTYFLIDFPFSYKEFSKKYEQSRVKEIPGCILETKIDNPNLTPDWLLNGIKQFGLKETSFSKYTTGIKSILDKFRIIL